MSIDDPAASAWADDTSPGTSPKLSDRDIWGPPSDRPERRDDLHLDLVPESELGLGETQGEEDVWRLAGGSGRNDDEGKSVAAEPDADSQPNETHKRHESDEQLQRTEETSHTIPPPADAPADPSQPTPIPQLPVIPATEQPPSDDGSDDGFGDFDSPQPYASTSTAYLPAASPTPLPAGDDEFGDFGDFEDFDAIDVAAAPSGALEFGLTADDGIPGGFTDEPEQSVWEDPDRPPPLKSLSLDPFPPLDLSDQISTLLSAIFPSRHDPTHTSHLTREPIRQVDGVQQLLHTESSRELYAQLITPPQLKPLDWKRSRVRREQLISLGIPVNLDEVDTSRLPPLKIVTKEGAARAATARNGRGPKERQRTTDERKVGEPPTFDRERAERLLSYREDQLSLVPAAYLSRMQQDLVSSCSTASAIVAHLKQIQEIRTDDNKQKNEQIAGLIAQAQRVKAGEAAGVGGGGGLFRKGSSKKNSMTLSGVNTPRRMASPSMMSR